MSPFVPKQRSHPGVFAPESVHFIRTECNSCPRAIAESLVPQASTFGNRKTKVRFLHPYDVETGALECDFKLPVVWDFSLLKLWIQPAEGLQAL